jgi:hypothetical protein
VFGVFSAGVILVWRAKPTIWLCQLIPCASLSGEGFSGKERFV